MEIRIDYVRVEGRYRKDLGDITTLAQSIASVGLINPITVTTDGRLIAGERRLTACRSLGWEHIAAIQVDALDEAVARLTAERDENTERKEMAVSERVALARALEELERPRATARREAAQFGRSVPDGTDRVGSENARTADVAGRAVGLPSNTYYKARKVVDFAADDSQPAEVREVAQAALAEMDATGNVTGPYEKVRGIRDRTLTAPKRTTIQAAAQQRKAVGAAISTLSGISYGLKQVDELHPDITSEEAAQWVDGLSEARRVLEVLIKRCKERINNA